MHKQLLVTDPPVTNLRGSHLCNRALGVADPKARFF